MTFKRGDAVTITVDGRTMDGTVLLASENGRSLMLEFEAILLGYVGMMPVLLHDEGVYRDLVTGEPVKIELRT